MYLHGKKSGRETGRERCLAYLSKNINVNIEKRTKNTVIIELHKYQ